MIRPLAIAVAAAALLAPWAQGAHAAPAYERTTVEGDVLRLTSIQDPAAMSAMRVGEPVPWVVGIQAARDAGTIEVLLEVEATDSAFDAAIEACDVEWTAHGCATGAERIVDGPLEDGVLELGAHDAHGDRWYLLDVALLPGASEGRADLVVRAMGLGDEIESGGAGVAGRDGGPALTGARLPATGAPLAVAAVAAGLLLAGVASLARRRHGARS